MDLSNFREEYLKGQLHRKDLAENPFEQFQTWFEQALKADIPEPNAFSLATADAQGRPSLRTGGSPARESCLSTSSTKAFTWVDEVPLQITK